MMEAIGLNHFRHSNLQDVGWDEPSLLARYWSTTWNTADRMLTLFKIITLVIISKYGIATTVRTTSPSDTKNSTNNT